MSRPLDLVVDRLRRLEAIIELVAPMIATCLLAVEPMKRGLFPSGGRHDCGTIILRRERGRSRKV
jgi:hypothetical protein